MLEAITIGLDFMIITFSVTTVIIMHKTKKNYVKTLGSLRNYISRLDAELYQCRRELQISEEKRREENEKQFKIIASPQKRTF